MSAARAASPVISTVWALRPLGAAGLLLIAAADVALIGVPRLVAGTLAGLGFPLRA
jgi:hypothetical protein